MPGPYLSRMSSEERNAHRSDKLAHDLEHQVQEALAGERGQHESHSDERLSNFLHLANFARMGGILFGKVVYSLPHADWFRVQLDDLNGDLPCCRLSDSTSKIMGVKDGSPLAPDTDVLVWVPPEGLSGFILGAVPPRVDDYSVTHPDFVVMGSQSGIKREAYYRELFELTQDDGGAMDYSNGRPIDAAGLGEWSKFSDLGGAIHLDPFLLMLRMDETCGLWLHYLNRLARLAGYNFDLRTAVDELMVRDDCGELAHCWGFALYPWEALGAWTFGAQVRREVDEFDSQYLKPFAVVEPQYDDQQAIHRLEEFRGYLGQAFMRQLCTQPINASSQPNRYSDTSPRVGLFREQLGLNGSWEVASAHSISLVKRVIIPYPKRIRNPEDKQGDTDSNYSASGLFSGGESHEIDSLKTQSEAPAQRLAAGLDDWMAHAFNWKGLHPFHYHQGDFSVPEESELPFDTIQQLPSYQSLSTQQWLDPPEPKQIVIDHRYGTQDYYETQAGVFILPHGDVVIRNTMGAEIKLVGADIQESAPGDIWRRSGRSLLDWSGDDIILRARNSIDGTATQHDVRFKSEFNMEFVAGNGSRGRMLFENKSESDEHDYNGKFGEELTGSGFIFKAENSDFITAVKEIYLRTGGPDEVTPGPITIDAAQGEQDIRTVSRSIISHLEQEHQMAFPVRGSKETVNTFSVNNTQIQTGCTFDGGLTVCKDGMTIKGNIAVVGGHIGTQEAQKFLFFVGWLRDNSLQAAKATLEEVTREKNRLKGEARDDFDESILNRMYVGDENQIGSKTFQQLAAFSLRTEDQMGTTDFKIPEDYWQQLSRLGLQSLQVWSERSITYQQEEMMPHPGKKKWAEEPSFLKADQLLRDKDFDKPRDPDLYGHPVLNDWDTTIPNQEYVVTSQ